MTVLGIIVAVALGLVVAQLIADLMGTSIGEWLVMGSLVVLVGCLVAAAAASGPTVGERREERQRAAQGVQ